MKKGYSQLFLAAAACAFVLSATASMKNPVERPAAWKGTATLEVDLSPLFLAGETTLPWRVVEETGTMKHLGQYSSHGGGEIVVEVVDGELYMINLVGDGYVIAANGDRLNWHEELTGATPTVTTTVLTNNGGTGRFLYATGTATTQTVLISETLDPVAMLLTMTVTVTGTGTITY